MGGADVLTIEGYRPGEMVENNATRARIIGIEVPEGASIVGFYRDAAMTERIDDLEFERPHDQPLRTSPLAS
jgi:hypothetical protein